MSTLPLVNVFELHQLYSNETLIIEYTQTDNYLFIHGYDRYSGKPIQNLLDCVSVKIEKIVNGVVKILDVTPFISSKHFNRLDINDLFSTTELGLLKITIECGTLKEYASSNNLIIGIK